MDSIIQFFIQAEIWIYIILAFIFVVYLYRGIRSWREWRNALFGLEKEISQKRIVAAGSVLLLLISFALAEFIVVTFIFNQLPGDISLSTPTMDALTSPTAAVLPGTLIPESSITQTVGSTITADDCIDGQIQWSSPEEGESINGSVQLEGTVNVPNLGFYRFDYQASGQDEWTVISINNQPVIDGPLGGTWNTSILAAGDYSLRLTVYDNENISFPACTIRVQVETP